ncbi:MAG: (p)ppGpp synthetase SpoT/RelA, partial [Bacteroidota bacterium]
WVTTSKARYKIRQAVKEEHRKAGEIGKEYLQRKLKNMKVDFDDTNIDTIVRFFAMNTRVDLYYAIAKEQIDMLKLKELRIEAHKFLLPERPKVADTENTKILPIIIPTQKGEKEVKKNILLVAGQNAAQYTFQFASCCNPLPGDDVFAYMSTGGMRIHRLDCRNAEHLFANLSHRIMKAEWVTEIRQSFTAKLLVRGVDNIGVLQQLSQIITSKLNININAISIKGDAGFFEGRLTVTIFNRDQLDHLIATLETQKNIDTVTRIDGTEDKAAETTTDS